MSGTDLGEKLIALAVSLCKDDNYEAGFHALMAALHVADRTGDVQLLERVLQSARIQEAAVDAIEPPHRISSRAAMHRNQTPLFRTLGIHAEAMRARHRKKA